MFNNDKLLDEFIKYSLQDSLVLYESIKNAAIKYFLTYKIDISSILSTSSLSMKIFRTSFLDNDIPVLKKSHDSYIRNSYIGGATDYYKLYGENLHYYDVNSLYPFAMLKPMPLNIVKFHKDLSNTDLDNFFGFALAEIYCPDSIQIPVLPFKFNNRTIYPKGHWKATYFSEELKAVKAIGYKVKLIYGYEFTKADLFTNYVNNFYELKKNSAGSTRFIAKMHLNQLYGIFGRKKDLIETVVINNKDLNNYLLTKIIRTIIDIGNDKSILLIKNNIPTKIIKELNLKTSNEISNKNVDVKSNVAIASAITSYARIHMIQFKLNNSIYYSDTDSIFTDKPLDANLIGKDLGLMKDELNGLLIKEAYFLGIKKYGYWYLDENGNRIEKSTIAGIPRDSVSFDEIKDLVKGKTITRDINNSFYHDFTKLDINIKSHKVTISFTPDKKLINNEYKAPIINEFSKSRLLINVVKNILNKYYNLIRKHFKIY